MSAADQNIPVVLTILTIKRRGSPTERLYFKISLASSIHRVSSLPSNPLSAARITARVIQHSRSFAVQKIRARIASALSIFE